MDFSAFDTRKIDEYAKQAKEQWGKTDAYKEYEEKTQNRTADEWNEITKGMRQLFEEFGRLRLEEAGGEAAQQQVKKLQTYITENYYTCTDEILYSLGQMYAGGGDFTENIDKMGGAGTAEFAAAAICAYCGRE